MHAQALDVVVGVLVLVVLLAGNDRVRRSAIASATPLAVRLQVALAPPPEVDEAADELYRAVRRERLRAHVRRVEALLATDMSMSATRQIGNRLAYGWLVRELDRSTAGLPLWLRDPAAGADVRGPSPIGLVDEDPRHHPQVETLTIGR